MNLHCKAKVRGGYSRCKNLHCAFQPKAITRPRVVAGHAIELDASATDELHYGGHIKGF